MLIIWRQLGARDYDPFSLTPENVAVTFNRIARQVERLDDKLSPALAGCIATVVILRDIDEAVYEYRDAIDARVMAGGHVTEWEDTKYILGDELRKTLWTPLLRLSGYRPSHGDGAVENHPLSRRA